MNKVVATIASPAHWTGEELALIKSQICKGSDEELKLFLYMCKHTGLNPLTRQIYAVHRGGKMSIQTSIDGYRLIAQRTGDYAGQTGPLWCAEDGVWRDVWLSKDAPAASKVGILRHTFSEPSWGVARFDEYAQMGSPMWKKMPATMIAKCAESLGLRKAFPQELSGVYTAEEMAQAEPERKSAYKAKKDNDWPRLESEMAAIASVDDLRSWGEANADLIKSWPDTWQAHWHEAYARKLHELKDSYADSPLKKQLKASLNEVASHAEELAEETGGVFGVPGHQRVQRKKGEPRTNKTAYAERAMIAAQKVAEVIDPETGEYIEIASPQEFAIILADYAGRYRQADDRSTIEEIHEEAKSLVNVTSTDAKRLDELYYEELERHG